MLNKLLNMRTLAQYFLYTSLFTVLLYVIALTLYLSMPPSGGYTVLIFEKAVLWFEYIVCAFTAVLAFGAGVVYYFRKNK